MPTVTNNSILQGLSGKLGKVVLRQLHGKTIMQAAPIRKAPFRPGELTNQEKFKKAIAYAKNARQNPELWEIYLKEAKRRGGTSNAWSVAVSDFMKGLKLQKEKLPLPPARKQPAFPLKTAAAALLKSPGNGMRRVFRLVKITRLRRQRISYSGSGKSNRIIGQSGFNSS